MKELGSSRDISALTVALETSQRDGPVERDLEDARRRQTRIQAVVAQALERLHLDDRDPAAVAALVPPTRENVVDFREEWQALGRETETIRSNRQDWLDKQATTERDLRALELARPVPSLADLEAAREARDTAWTSLRQQWATGGQIDTEVCAAYEQAVVTVDGLADQLWHEAERVTQRAQLQADLEAQDAALRWLTDQATDCERHRSTWAERWAEVWQPTSVDAPPQTEALVWLENHATVVERQPELAEVTALVADLTARRSAPCGTDNERGDSLRSRHARGTPGACRPGAAQDGEVRAAAARSRGGLGQSSRGTADPR
jgi:hypothetical protein